MSWRRSVPLLLALSLLLAGCSSYSSTHDKPVVFKHELIGYCEGVCLAAHLATNTRGDEVASWAALSSSDAANGPTESLVPVYSSYRPAGGQWSHPVVVTRGYGQSTLSIDGAGNAYLDNMPLARSTGVAGPVFIRSRQSGSWLTTKLATSHWLGPWFRYQLLPLPGAGAVAVWTSAGKNDDRPFRPHVAVWDVHAGRWQQLVAPATAGDTFSFNAALGDNGELGGVWQDFLKQTPPRRPVNRIHLALQMQGQPWQPSTAFDLRAGRPPAAAGNRCLALSGCPLLLQGGAAFTLYEDERAPSLILVRLKRGQEQAVSLPSRSGTTRDHELPVGMVNPFSGYLYLHLQHAPAASRAAVAKLLGPALPALLGPIVVNRYYLSANSKHPWQQFYLLPFKSGRWQSAQPLPQSSVVGQWLASLSMPPFSGINDQGLMARSGGRTQIILPVDARSSVGYVDKQQHRHSGEYVAVIDIG